MRFIIDVQPVHSAGFGNFGGFAHQLLTNAAPLESWMDGDIQQKGVDAAIPRHVDKAY